jgi:hypothetical protein
LRDFARKSAIKYISVQQYSSDLERIQIRSLKIKRFFFGFEENKLGGNAVALLSIIRDTKKNCKVEALTRLHARFLFFSLRTTQKRAVKVALYSRALFQGK